MSQSCLATKDKEFTTDYWLTLAEFKTLFKDVTFSIDEKSSSRLIETRTFIDYLLEKKIRVYGLTTGFADLRDAGVDAEKAALLSKNMIRSHDAGIGEPLPLDVTFGAMCVRAHSLSKGYSGFSLDSFQTLVGMINARIIPEIPSTGSLGASGDLAFLARLGMAMMGEDVPVHYNGSRMSAKEALSLAAIEPMNPLAKEGLALTNGTSFMASMLAIAYNRQILLLENLFSLLGLFLNATSATDAAFYEMIHTARHQKGQIKVAELLRPFLPDQADTEVQNDYCIRCLPQILGPKLEIIFEQKEKIERELNAITDNPLIFRGSEISPDTDPARTISFDGQDWAVVSGGNFHGETSATIADTLAIANAKIALTMERQLTYMLNPFRNKNRLPVYLINDPAKVGVESGFMITQYTGNALAHKIALLASPASAYNMTSANESEDVVSYGATAANKLLNQITHMEELLAIFLVTCAQSYSIARENKSIKNPLCEDLFEKISHKIAFPIKEDTNFGEIYKTAGDLLSSGALAQKIAL